MKEYIMRKIISFCIISILLFVSCDSSMKKKFKRAKRLSRTDKLEKWEEAIKEFDEIVKMKVNAREYQVNLYRKLGKRHMQMEHWNDSLKYYLKAFEALPNEGIIHYKLGVCYSQISRSIEDKVEYMKMVKKAEAEYKMAISLNNKLIDPYYGLGIIYFYVYKNYKKGIEYMFEVIKRDSKNIDAHFALGRFYYDVGEASRAFEFYSALLSLVPENDARYSQVKNNIQRIQNEIRGPQ